MPLDRCGVNHEGSHVENPERHLSSPTLRTPSKTEPFSPAPLSLSEPSGPQCVTWGRVCLHLGSEQEAGRVGSSWALSCPSRHLRNNRNVLAGVHPCPFARRAAVCLGLYPIPQHSCFLPFHPCQVGSNRLSSSLNLAFSPVSASF